MASRASSLLILCHHLALCLASVCSYGPDALASCLAASSVPFTAKNSTSWIPEIRPYNLRLPYTPAAVAIPTSINHIKAAVSCGVENGVRVSARGGGHSYGSFGLGGEDGHLVIVLDSMDSVTLGEDGKAVVQPGARLGHVAYELFNQGHRAISHGTCPGVGVAGHVLHGGYGMASRTYGLTLDWLVGAKVVLADGSLVHCSATENEDLFWALRGAGSSFGIVAEFEFNTFVAPELVTPFAIDLNWNEDQAVQGLLAFQEVAVNAPRELNMQIYMASTGQTVQGAYYGDRSGLEKVLEPFLGEVNAKISRSTSMGWIESVQYWAGSQQLNQRRPYNLTSTFYTTSLMTPALSRAQLRSFVGTLFESAKDATARRSWYLLLDLHGGNNSAIADVEPSETAYVHRDKLLLYQFTDRGSSGEYPEEGFGLLKGFRDSVTTLMDEEDWGMYANYLDTQVSGDQAQALYWGKNLGRLRNIKAELDPDEVFWNPQGVRPVE